MHINKNFRLFLALPVILIFLTGCGPSPEEIAEQEIVKQEIVKQKTAEQKVKELYQNLINDPYKSACKNEEEFKRLKSMEARNGTDLYQHEAERMIKYYSSRCFDNAGNWTYGFYVDEFGDSTNQGYVSQTVKGTFSNSATEGSRLRVSMFLSINSSGTGYRVPISFRLYEYDGKNPVKGRWSYDNQWASNNLYCRIKYGDGRIVSLEMMQSEGNDYFTIYGLRSAIESEGKAAFSCEKVKSPLTKYFFKFDFAYFKNVMKQFNSR